MNHSLFRGGDPAEDTQPQPQPSDAAPTRRLAAFRMSRPTAEKNENTTELQDPAAGEARRRKILKIAAIAAIVVVIVGLGTGLAVSLLHTSSVHDDYKRQIANLQSAHAEQMANLAEEDARRQAAAVAAAITKQKQIADRRVRRAIHAERRKAKRKIADARAAGYSAGNAAGYSAGNAAGYDQGLYAGSDDLTCSDDPDVTWLPYCW